jgi:hypothetical protein
MLVESSLVVDAVVKGMTLASADQKSFSIEIVDKKLG